MWQKMRFFFLKCSCYFTLHPAPFSHSCWHRSAVLTPGTKREEEGARPEEEEDSNRAVSSLKHRSVSVSVRILVGMKQFYSQFSHTFFTVSHMFRARTLIVEEMATINL